MKIRDKQKILLLMTLFAINAIQAQVGINTSSPIGVFHIDARVLGTTTDDIVITKEGRVGIGTVSPQNQLDIVSSVPGAIRIADGSEGVGKVLSSNGAGIAGWQNLQGTWSASLFGGNLPYTMATNYRKIGFSRSSISGNGLGSADPSTGTIIVPYKGTYRITLFGMSHMNRVSGFFIAGFFNLYVNNVGGRWGPHSLGHTGISSSIYVSYTIFLYFQANDKLELYNTEIATGFANGVSDLTMMVEFVK